MPAPLSRSGLSSRQVALAESHAHGNGCLLSICHLSYSFLEGGWKPWPKGREASSSEGQVAAFISAVVPTDTGSGQRLQDCKGPSRRTGDVTSSFEYKTIETLNANKLEIFYWGKKKRWLGGIQKLLRNKICSCQTTLQDRMGTKYWWINNSGGWRDGSEGKSTGHCSRRPGLNSQNSHGISHLSVTPVPGDQFQHPHTDTLTGKTPMYRR